MGEREGRKGREGGGGGEGSEYSMLSLSHTEVDFCVRVCMLTTQHRQDRIDTR